MLLPASSIHGEYENVWPVFGTSLVQK